MSWRPTRLLLEVLYVGACVLHVAVGGKAHREESGRKTFERGTVSPNEVTDACVMLAHMDGASDDGCVVGIHKGIRRPFEVQRVCLVALAPNHIGNVFRNPRRMSL